MPIFPSREWCEAVIRFANADPESALAGESWVGDFGAVVESEPGKLLKPFAVHCVPAGGKITKFDTSNNQWTEFTPPTYPANVRRGVGVASFRVAHARRSRSGRADPAR